jgi:hypothetical protein
VAQLIDEAAPPIAKGGTAEYLNGDADLDMAGARGDGAGDAERCGQDRPPRLERELGQPHHIEPQPLGRIDLLHRLVERLALGPTRKRRKLVKHAEFHRVLLLRRHEPRT